MREKSQILFKILPMMRSHMGIHFINRTYIYLDNYIHIYVNIYIFVNIHIYIFTCTSINIVIGITELNPIIGCLFVLLYHINSSSLLLINIHFSLPTSSSIIFISTFIFFGFIFSFILFFVLLSLYLS